MSGNAQASGRVVVASRADAPIAAAMCALLVASCASRVPEPPSVDLATIYGQLAAACGSAPAANHERIDPTRLTNSPPNSDVSAKRRPPMRRPTSSAVDACLETATLSARDDPVNKVTPQWGAEPDASSNRTGPPRPLTMRFAPDGLDLRPADAMVLAKALTVALAQADVRAEVAVGRGGLGNGFQQAMIAHKRVHRINQMLPAGLVTSVTYDPELADDSLVVTFVPAGQ
ncbi:MAG: hypothetical protein R3D27_06755 [Hyphomicrobiaceae bacterium]